MFPTQNTPLPFTITPFNITTDLDALSHIWTASLPQYPLPKANLEALLPRQNAHHLIARKDSDTDTDSTPIAFCLTYRTDQVSGHIAVLAVTPAYQRQGIGSALLAEAVNKFKSNAGSASGSASEPCDVTVTVGSTFPRFWPGVPIGLGEGVLEFFSKRGFEPKSGRSVDLYQDIESFEVKEEYVSRARDAGYTFAALQEDGYEECLEGQRRNFSYNADWVAMYHNLPPTTHPSSIMTAFDTHGTQVGWTLMLHPSSPILKQNWAMPAVCGSKTGLIGCVGVDSEHRRRSGVGLALVAHAVEDLKRRGVQGVFVDWVSLEGFYERVGFGVWMGGYREGKIS
ncbi:hypothetical protein BDV12DRAFT_187667 [Aspergillus spectabilis]